MLAHAEVVAGKAEAVARAVPHLRPDVAFVVEAAWLHDIGIFLTNAPRIGCLGEHSYICHGYLGRALLEAEGLPRHALVAERHVGVGLSVDDIRSARFPLPEREMIPQTVEERIVCYADKFFSKDDDPRREKPIETVRATIARYGAGKLEAFEALHRIFGMEDGSRA